MGSILGALCAMFVVIALSARRNGRPLQVLIVFVTLIGTAAGQTASGIAVMAQAATIDPDGVGMLALLIGSALGLNPASLAAGFGTALLATFILGWLAVVCAGPPRPLPVRMPTAEELDRDL